MKTLTQKRLKEMLHYNEETGLFTWIQRPNRRILIGSVAGNIQSTERQRGRVTIHIDRMGFFAHRLAWLYVIGEFPSQHIDHIDGDPGNNRFSNLRDVSPIQNSQNLRRQPTGCKSGLLGAAKGRPGKWVAQIKVNKQSKYLGEFDTANEAHEAYIAAKRKYHSTCAI